MITRVAATSCYVSLFYLEDEELKILEIAEGVIKEWDAFLTSRGL